MTRAINTKLGHLLQLEMVSHNSIEPLEGNTQKLLNYRSAFRVCFKLTNLRFRLAAVAIHFIFRKLVCFPIVRRLQYNATPHPHHDGNNFWWNNKVLKTKTDKVIHQRERFPVESYRPYSCRQSFPGGPCPAGTFHPYLDVRSAPNHHLAVNHPYLPHSDRLTSPSSQLQ